MCCERKCVFSVPRGLIHPDSTLLYTRVTLRSSCLLQNERDVSVRLRAVDLLFAMCDHSNAVTVVNELLNYLKTRADYSIREELVRMLFLYNFVYCGILVFELLCMYFVGVRILDVRDLV